MQRVVPGQHHHHCPHVDLRRPPCVIRQQLGWVGDHRVRRVMVLDRPNRVIPERFDEVSESEFLVVDLGIRGLRGPVELLCVVTVPVEVVLKEQADADFHAQIPLISMAATSFRISALQRRRFGEKQWLNVARRSVAPQLGPPHHPRAGRAYTGAQPLCRLRSGHQAGTMRRTATTWCTHSERLVSCTVAPVWGASMTMPDPMYMPTWPGAPPGPGSEPSVKRRSPGASWVMSKMGWPAYTWS